MDQEDRLLSWPMARVAVFYLGHLQVWLDNFQGSVQNEMPNPIQKEGKKNTFKGIKT